MRESRGTVILCDQLYPTIGGKWVIAGTYTNYLADLGAQHVDFIHGLNVYLRFQVERTGKYPCELLLVNRALASNLPAIQRLEVRIAVTDPLAPVEIGCVLPPFRVRCPNTPDVPVDTAIGVALLVWLKVDGEDVATCPLNVIFQPYRGPGHAGDSSQRPDAGGRA